MVLSLFPGIGIFDMAFEEQGFCVVRGPDALWGGDIKNFHPPYGVFDGVIGGPPCQSFSPLRRLVEHNGYEVAEDLIPEFERCVREAQPRWFVMENVRAAPTPTVPGYRVNDYLANNRWCGGVQNRLRRFSFGTYDGRPLMLEFQALEPAEYRPAVLASGSVWHPGPYVWKDGYTRSRRKSRVYGGKNSRYLKQAIRDQGLPDGFLDDAPFTVRGKIKVVGNGVPLPLGRTVAKAVAEAVGLDSRSGQTALGVDA